MKVTEWIDFKLATERLMKRQYNMMKKYGWTDPSLSDCHYVIMIVDEICEAINADRIGLYINDNEEYQYKDTVSDELADAFLRILNLMHIRSLDVEIYLDLYDEVMKDVKIDSFTETAFHLVNFITSHFIPIKERLNFSIVYIYAWSNHLGIDIMEAARRKYEYNKTRKDWKKKIKRYN